MSRLGFKPISLPSGATLTINGDHVITVKGAKGELSVRIPADVSVEAKDCAMSASRLKQSKNETQG
jgi:large subunit ribosomal protein L6